MNHTDSPETVKNPKKNKDAGKSPQELYDRYIQKGDEAIIAEDIVLAEKYYQHADYHLRCMNDPHHCGNIPGMQPSASSCSVEELIKKALKGIAAERAARKAVFMEKAREAARAAKTAKQKRKAKAIKKTKAAYRKQAAQAKTLDDKKAINEKPENRDKPCNIILLNSTISCAGVEKQS